MPSCAAVPVLRIIHILLRFPNTVRNCRPPLPVHLERSRVLLVQPECPEKSMHVSPLILSIYILHYTLKWPKLHYAA